MISQELTLDCKHEIRSLVALVLLAGLGLFGGCKSSVSTSATFRDQPSRFSITAPQGWFMQSGDELRKQAEGEAARLGDPRLGTPARGASHELIVRITRYQPGQAPEPNPTVVCTKFDLRKLPPGTTTENLLRMGTATARVERDPANVQLAGRVWQTMTVSRLMRDATGKQFEVVQQVYLTAGERWAIGLTISALREQYMRYEPAFDAILKSMKLENSSL
jgi:hypothetical protein